MTEKAAERNLGAVVFFWLGTDNSADAKVTAERAGLKCEKKG